MSLRKYDASQNSRATFDDDIGVKSYRTSRLVPRISERRLDEERKIILKRAVSHVPDVVAKLHVEVAVEDGLALLALFQRHRRGILENVERRLAKHPCLRVVARHHSHADAQVAVPAEHVDSTAESRSLRSAVADLSADQQNERQRQEEESRG